MKKRLKEIRTQLRLAMNGVVSTSMREKGVAYKLNFGVSIPKIKEIAKKQSKDASLAEALWTEDIREMKILATLLQPAESFTREHAERWVRMITQPEIAEQYVFNLLQELPYAGDLAAGWIQEESEFIRLSGFLLFARLSLQGKETGSGNAAILVPEAKKEMDAGQSNLQRAALSALKYYGRESAEKASSVLSALSDYPSSPSQEKKEFYEDLKFEFEYYR